MWPWEHTLFAYLVNSLATHLSIGEPPQDGPVIALVLGSVLPDVIDKPLAWQFGIVKSGYAIAHSIFVAIPFNLCVMVVGVKFGKPRVAIAFSLGYLLHLLGDVFPSFLATGKLQWQQITWPIGRRRPDPYESSIGGFIENFTEYFERLISFELNAPIIIGIGTTIVGIALWVYDGTPGIHRLGDAHREE